MIIVRDMAIIFMPIGPVIKVVNHHYNHTFKGKPPGHLDGGQERKLKSVHHLKKSSGI